MTSSGIAPVTTGAVSERQSQSPIESEAGCVPMKSAVVEVTAVGVPENITSNPGLLITRSQRLVIV